MNDIYFMMNDLVRFLEGLIPYFPILICVLAVIKLLSSGISFATKMLYFMIIAVIIVILWQWASTGSTPFLPWKIPDANLNILAI